MLYFIIVLLAFCVKLFFSGMRVTYNMKNAVGSRVQSVTIRCSDCKEPSYEPIDQNRQYTIITTKYLMNGGDQFTMIKNGIINAVDLSECRLSSGLLLLRVVYL